MRELSESLIKLQTGMKPGKAAHCRIPAGAIVPAGGGSSINIGLNWCGHYLNSCRTVWQKALRRS